MAELNKIGIIGYGKMGRDIFDALHVKCPDTQFVIFVRHDIEAESEKTAKNLSKALRRKKISEEAFEKLSANYEFTDSLEKFSDCDFILESVSENCEIKKELFSELDRIADKKCVFATNTSSLRNSDIFSGCGNGRVTMGLHFFYPVKLSGYVELNDCMDIETGKKIAALAGKDTVIFRGDYCIYLNQFISFCLAHAFLLAEKYQLSIRQCMDILSDVFPVHSLFGMADSIGLGLLTSGDNDSKVERIRPVLDFGRKKMLSCIDAGCSAETGKFIEFINSYEKDCIDKETDREGFIADMLCVVINEAVTAASETEGAVLDALYDAVGLSEDFSSIYKKYGYDKIYESIQRINHYAGSEMYKPAGAEFYSDL